MSSYSYASKAGYLNENYHYFHLQDTAGQERDFHFHEFDKLVYLISGSVDYIVEDVVYTLTPGSFLPVGHHSVHKAEIDKSCPYDRVIIYLDRKYFERIFPDMSLTRCFSDAVDRENRLILPEREELDRINRIISSYESIEKDTGPGSNAMRCTYIVQLLILLNSAHEARSEKRKIPDSSYDEKIQSTLSYINENLKSELSVDMLAERVYLSRYYFMHLFKQQTGTTVHAYIRQKRLLHASRLIRQGCTAAQAAAETGFSDYSTFNRAFRDCFGFGPSELKK